MLIHPDSKLLMIGDSITDCGRARPVGKASDGGLGNGYVSLVDSLLNATFPEMHIRTVNMGISGNTVRDLKARWQSDVLRIKPDWLSIMIGINDVWRHFDTWLLLNKQVSLEEFSSTLEELVRNSLPGLKGLVLMTPYYIDLNRSDPMRSMMDRYGSVVRELAEKYEAVLVDTQAAFDGVLKEFHPVALAGDRIHPNLTGHMIITRAFLKAIGYTWQPL
jgi:lysophospholipase L1-like esterase